MIEYVDKLIRRHKTILLDSGVLLLYFIGSLDPSIIPKFKRTQVFAEEDFATLCRLLSHFETIATTPNVMTEVCNLSAQLGEPKRLTLFEELANGIALLDERYLPSASIAKLQEFTKFGLTDIGIAQLARGGCLTLTTDFKLSQYLQKEGIDAINFNNVRPYYWE